MSSGSQVGSQRGATPGDIQPRKAQVDATQGHARPHPATGGVCMACKSWCPRGTLRRRENPGQAGVGADGLPPTWTAGSSSPQLRRSNSRQTTPGRRRG
jgi:hypothetical protein